MAPVILRDLPLSIVVFIQVSVVNLNPRKEGVKKIIILGVLFAVLCVAGAVSAEEDLVGTWGAVGDGWGAKAGTGGSNFGNGDTFGSMSNQFTLTVESQENGGFHGSWCSPNHCEDLVGAVRSDGSLIMADEDTYFFGAMIDGQMEVCTMEASAEFRVASCRMMQRQ